jgi:hypothetical protein
MQVEVGAGPDDPTIHPGRAGWKGWLTP